MPFYSHSPVSCDMSLQNMLCQKRFLRFCNQLVKHRIEGLSLFQALEGKEKCREARNEAAVQRHHGEDIQSGALRRLGDAAGPPLGRVPVLPPDAPRA